MTPLQADDRPSNWRNQSVATSSTSVSAGLDCHARPSTPSPVLAKSPRTLESSPLHGKYPKNLGWDQCERPGTTTSSRSRTILSNGSGVSGGEAGSLALTSPGA